MTRATQEHFVRPNSLGDLRAEADGDMLSRAFLETADFRTLIETSDRTIVVGRRGTGKSALALRISGHWQGDNRVRVVRISPEEYHVIGARPLVNHFGGTFSKIRAGCRLVWLYTLMMEAAVSLAPKFAFANSDGYLAIRARAETWRSFGLTVPDRFSRLLDQTLDLSDSSERSIGKLPIDLDLRSVEKSLASACSDSRMTVVFLIDKLDEGYEPDEIGIGYVDGLVQAAIDIKTRIPQIRPIVFLRDNIFRAVRVYDQDFSRNIEGSVLRLHWDVDALFNFATKRISIATNSKEQSSALKIWNRFTADRLKGKKGFQDCLQHTLYRPRDLLSLLNEAFYLAGKSGQEVIVPEHIVATSNFISQNRLDDLRKEYSVILPGLVEYTGAFQGRDPEMSVKQACDLIAALLGAGSADAKVYQDFLIVGDPVTVLRSLYSTGFIGVKHRTTGTFVFCHDGRAPDQDFGLQDFILVHPCYWSALNMTREVLTKTEAEEIFDEYDIVISSETPEIRNARIKELIEELARIPEGKEGATDFESWCLSAVRICFAKGLRNVELKPNKNAKSRRDIVATNLGDGDAWKRVYDDYGTRQVIFEVKNYQELRPSDYYQIEHYLSGEYGRIAFVITRASSNDVYADKDLQWIREMYSTDKKILVVKLCGRWFAKMLDRLRNPQKHDAVNDAIHNILDTYTRLYIEGQSLPKKRRKKR
jgi:hypothetical protein